MFSVTEISEMCISITIFHNDSIFHNLYVLHYLFRTKEKERSKSTGTVGNKKKDNTPKCKCLLSTPGRGTKAQPDTSLTLAEPKPSTSSGKRKVRASTKGDMSRESRSSTSLTTSATSKKKVKIEKELFGICVIYEIDMIIFNTIKEDVRDIVMEVIKEFKESYDKEINDVSNSLIDEMAIETLIDLLHDEKKELLIYEDFICTFSKEILDEGMLEVVIIETKS